MAAENISLRVESEASVGGGGLDVVVFSPEADAAVTTSQEVGLQSSSLPFLVPSH